MSPRNLKLSPQLDGRLAAYATLAGVALAAPAIPNADASIVWSGPVNINIPSTTAGVYLNVATGVFATAPAGSPGWDVNPWSSSALNFFTPTPNPGGGEMIGTGTNYLNLFNQLGTFQVGPAGTYANAGSTTISAGTPLNLNSSNNYMGFRFINETMANQVQYGWLQVTLSTTAQGQPRAVVSYAYENSGAPITVGAVPEPSTMALLGVMAAGALGVRAWRKRKVG
jgi:hypothetical protein